MHTDHVGPFESSNKKNKYVLVIVDAFTKFTIIEPVKDTRAKRTIKILVNVIHLFGVSHRIISDRGTAFMARSFTVVCSTYGIKHVLNAVATPRAGYKARNSAESSLLQEVQTEMERLNLSELCKKIKKHITQDQRKQKERYDKARRETSQYEEGDVVMVEITNEQPTGESRKLSPKFKGLFRVHRVLYNDRYEVKDLREGGRGAKTVVAFERLKRWVAEVNE